MSFGRLRSPFRTFRRFWPKISSARSARSQKAKVTSPCTPRETICMDMGPTTHFLAYFRLVLGATNTPPAPRFRPVLGLAAPAAPFGSFGTSRDLGSPEPQKLPWQLLTILTASGSEPADFDYRGRLLPSSRPCEPCGLRDIHFSRSVSVTTRDAAIDIDDTPCRGYVHRATQLAPLTRRLPIVISYCKL